MTNISDLLQHSAGSNWHTRSYAPKCLKSGNRLDEFQTETLPDRCGACFFSSNAVEKSAPLRKRCARVEVAEWGRKQSYFSNQQK
jgi:hypothetical protein